MKRWSCFLLALALTASITSCGAGTGETPKETQTPPPANTADASNGGKGVEVESGLFDVTLTIPSDFVGEGTTQEDCDKIAKDNGYKSVTLNEDGSATYVVTKAQHEDMMKDIADSIQQGLAALVGSEEYPNFVSIETNEDYTEYTVTTKGNDVSPVESMAVLGFYMYSGMYHVFNGTTADNIHVQFINEATGDVIEDVNSKDTNS